MPKVRADKYYAVLNGRGGPNVYISREEVGFEHLPYLVTANWPPVSCGREASLIDGDGPSLSYTYII
jgi:hypothetical protein